MGLDPIGQAMMNGRDIQVHAHQTAKRPFHTRQSLVGQHRLLGVRLFTGHRGAQHVDAIDLRVRLDALLIALIAQPLRHDLPLEVFRHLQRSQRLAY